MIKLYKNGRRVVCYIQETRNGWRTCTGKPSDATCLAWHYETRAEAEKTAAEYLANYCSTLAALN